MYHNVYMLNACQLIGKITNAPDLKTTTDGRSVTDIRIAVERKPALPNHPPHDFFSVVAYGSVAGHVCNYMRKDTRVLVSGRLQTRKQTMTDGATKEIVEILADSVQPLDPLT